MTDVPLLVPMSVQALLVNPLVQSHVVFRRWSNVYENLENFLDPIPGAFSNVAADPPDKGVHLHWKLPSAITHGEAQAGEAVSFKCLPNRWLVLRRAAAPNATGAPQLTAWIVQSDFLDPEAGTSAFVDPSSTANDIKLTRIGRSVPIEQWQSEPGGAMFLKPTGIADVTFAAYQPGVLDVLSFYDPATGVAEGSLLTYLVAGWYSDTSEDPLVTHSAAVLNWVINGGDDTPPDLTVVHGMISGVEWQTTTLPDRIDPDASQMQVAVGYSSVDALSAIIAANAGSSAETLVSKLQAFQYNVLPTLDDPDGIAQLELLIRDAWFGTTPGGTRWKIVPVSQGQPASDQNAQLTRDPQAATPRLTADQQQWLAALNRRQRDYDVAARELQTRQWELFAVWWKSQRGKFLDAYQFGQNFGIDTQALVQQLVDALDPGTPGSLLSVTAQLKAQVDAMRAALPDPTASDNSAFLAGLPPLPPPSQGAPPNPALELRAEALPAFFHPADPVLLVAGLDPPPAQPDAGATLQCRKVEAAVTGVTVGSVSVTRSSGSMASMIALPDFSRLPAAVAQALGALGVEAYFADPGNAAAIVANGAGGTGDAAKLAAAMAAGTAQISTISASLAASYAFAEWQQAWAPLFLEWEISWFPTVGAQTQTVEAPTGPLQSPPDSGGEIDNWPFLADVWSFDGSDNVSQRGSEYYRCNAAPPTDYPSTYSGRTFLTPQAGLLLAKRVDEYATLHPGDVDLGEIKDLIEAIGETRFLSQSLSGFNDAFVMRGLSHALPPSDPAVKAAVGDENRGVPMVELGDRDFSFDTGTPFFFPARGGSFRFERLALIDGFGQVLDLLAANGNSGSAATSFAPLRGPGLAPDDGAGFADAPRRIKQAPRIVQPARLDLRLLDRTDDSAEVYYAGGADPLCGWLLPNHLDRSIAVYDADGNSLGEMMVLADTDGTPTVRWLPTPNEQNPVTDPSQIANAHLRSILTAFFGTDGAIPAAGRAAAFMAFYKSIDETLWMVDPIGGQADQDLAVLIGRPIAVVRAQVQFELFGRPAVNQSWRDSLLDLDAGLTGLSFPIRLGSTELLDDGLIGYFAADSYATFNAVHASTTDTSPYVAAIAPQNYLSLDLAYPGYQQVTLTMLMDPRANVHATTGILPVATMQLPAEFYTGALARIAVTFRIGPLFTQPDAVRLPLPAEHNGAWAWIRHIGPGATDWEVDPIIAADATARLPDAPPRLMDGWLQFTPGTGQ